MTEADWTRVIDQSTALGVRMIQFIGGEPTLHPSLPDLVEHGLGNGLGVEVYSNLTHITPQLWDVFSQPGVRLATSYYSDQPGQHEKITKGRGSYTRTKANIVEALRRGIPLRVGVVDIHDSQRSDHAAAELKALGVEEIDTDRLRQIGRGIRQRKPDSMQLCGNCASGVLAVSPTGAVWPCVFSRWLSIGNVQDCSLSDIVNGKRLHEVRDELAASFRKRGAAAKCDPRCEPYTAGCHPECNPSCSPRCNPISCRPNCLPPRK
ncbi:iron-sulfur cluster protein [Herbihabitans rhizosphaerae]|uniref:Iron-sulfur cluster protein n=2 Tax=Herbihabitans rhizosphaerae TaxID=1872711 RepID=A0A4Q7L1X4_9PSEU|nr:iron-sulfur cluster protein [Herbihabitans rhizosphaerae]